MRQALWGADVEAIPAVFLAMAISEKTGDFYGIRNIL